MITANASKSCQPCKLAPFINYGDAASVDCKVSTPLNDQTPPTTHAHQRRSPHICFPPHAPFFEQNPQGKLVIFVDGGVRRGTDIFKCLALGASMVGVGRPALMSMAAYGVDGVNRMVDLLYDELEMAMRLMGARRIDDIKPDMVITKNLSDHVEPNPQNHLPLQNYHPMQPLGLSKM